MTEPTLPLGADVWDLDRLRLPADRVGNLETRRRPPRHRPGRPVHQGAGPSCLDRIGLSAPRGGSPGCYGLSVSLLPIPIGKPLGPGRHRQRVADHQPSRPDAASIRPSWPGCWPWNGSRVASWRSPSWISRSRRPGRSVGRCTGRSLGAGGSRPPGSRGGLSKLRRSVGSWRVGADRPISSWRWTVGPSSASPGSRPPGAWMSWSGPGWSPSVGRQAGLRIVTILDVGTGSGRQPKGRARGSEG